MRTLIVIVAVLCTIGPACGDVVVRRGSEPSIEGNLVGVDDSGVSVVSGLGATHRVPWDRIRAVESTQWRSEIEKMLPIADDLWRARSRLERLDTALAEPLFEKLFERYRGKTHETALVVAEGLLRCRLAHGAQELAVIPALEVARLQRANIHIDSFSMLGPVIDPETSLSPTVAPSWSGGALLHRLRDELAAYDAQGDQIIAAIARLYHQSTLAALGVEIGMAADERPRHPGVALLSGLVQCASGDTNHRRDAAERLANQMASMPPWAEAWARYHIGLALLRQNDPEMRDRGLVHLLHLPARFAQTQPWLTDLAVRQAADWLAANGDPAGAAALQSDRSPGTPMGNRSQPRRNASVGLSKEHG